MARQRTRRKTITVERNLDPSPSLFLDFLVSHNRIIRTGYAFARSQILPVVAEERRAYHGDDAGDNLRIYILQLRARLNEQTTIAQRALETAATNEARRFDRKFTAAISASANVDISALIRDDDLVDLLALRTSEHVSLIKSLSDDVFEHIERTSLGSILEGRGNRETEKLLAGLEGIDRRRATLIARDQASKLNGAMNRFRQEQAGVTHYKWSTTLDGRERPTHHANHGKRFAWAKAPPTGHPGHEINCRCRAKAIIIDDEETAAEFVGAPDLGSVAPIAANGAAIRAVGQTLAENVLSMPRDALLVRQANVRKVQSLLASLKGATEQVQEDLELFYERLYGHAAGDLPDGIIVAKRRSTQLRQAISERLDLIEDLVSHALIYGGTSNQ